MDFFACGLPLQSGLIGSILPLRNAGKNRQEKKLQRQMKGVAGFQLKNTI